MAEIGIAMFIIGGAIGGWYLGFVMGKSRR